MVMEFEDEDDHDPARLSIYDVALAKTVANSGPIPTRRRCDLYDYGL